MSAAQAEALLRWGRRRAERRRAALVKRVLAVGLAGVRMRADGERIALSGRGLLRRFLRGESGLIAWLEGLRALAGGLL